MSGEQTRLRDSFDASWQLVEQRAGLITFLVAASATALGAFITFRRATTPWSVLPDYDYWGNITGLITERGVTLDLASLFRHNNEHIVVIPKLIYVANYLITSGSNIGLIVYSICVGATCAILLLLLARDLLGDMPARWVFCAILFPLAMFSAKLSHSYFFGMSGAIWLTADLLVILSAIAMTRAAKSGSSAWLLASLLAALLGMLTYSTAIYSVVALIVFCGVLLFLPKFRSRIPWPVLAGVIAISLAVLAVWLIQRPHPRGHPPLEFDPIGLTGFVLIFMGSAVSNRYLQPVMGLVILAAGAFSIRRLLTVGRGLSILPWVILFLFAPFNSLNTGVGRLGFGVQAAASSRYMNVATISLIATIVLVLAALPKASVSRRAMRIKVATMVALLAMAVFFVTNAKTIKFYAKRLEKKPVAEIALRQDIASDEHLAAGTPSIAKFYQILPALRAAHHAPFNTHSYCENFIGHALPSALGALAGAIESIKTYTVSTVSHDTRTAIEITGWAVRAGDPAECIAVVDGNGLVIGAGLATGNRSDPLTKRLNQSGWLAVAPAPQNLPVCAFAQFPGATVWAPLASCQTEIGGAWHSLGPVDRLE